METLKSCLPLACATMLLITSSLMCEAAHKEAPQTGHRKPANVSRAQAAQNYDALLSEEQSLRALESEISRKLGSKIRESDYPKEARRQGWSGTTLVGVLVGSNGKIKEVSVSQTSGFSILDEQALRLLDRVTIWWSAASAQARSEGYGPSGVLHPQRLSQVARSLDWP